MEDLQNQSVRLDKWLKVARFYKKRPDATEAVENGSVKVNGERVKPAKSVKVGDLLTIRIETRYRNYKVLGITTKSVSAAKAKELYESLEPESHDSEVDEMMKILEKQDWQNRKAMKGRPTKKDRRSIEKLKSVDD